MLSNTDAFAWCATEAAKPERQSSISKLIKVLSHPGDGNSKCCLATGLHSVQLPTIQHLKLVVSNNPSKGNFNFVALVYHEQ